MQYQIDDNTNLSPKDIKKIRIMAKNAAMNLKNTTDGYQNLNGIELYDYSDDDLFFQGELGAKENVEEIITNKLIDLIKNSELPPWKQSWAKKQNIEAQNFVSKKPYTGGNAVFLNVILGSIAPSPYYLTMTQIMNLGGQLVKGSKGYPISLYNFTYKIKNVKSAPDVLSKILGRKLIRKKGNVTITEDNYTFLTLTESDIKFLGLESTEYYTVPIIKYYTVFNVADTTGIKWDLPESNKPRNQDERIFLAEKIVESFVDIPKIFPHKSEAYYEATKDTLHMPNIEQFDSAEFYYSTLFHEMIHATMHKTRLDRKSKYENKDKDAFYSFEELIAEFGASYLCGYAGIFDVVHLNQAKYLKTWNERLVNSTKSDFDFLITAAKEAKKAVDYILKNFDFDLLNNSKLPESKTPKNEDKKEDNDVDKAKAKARARARARLRILKLNK